MSYYVDYVKKLDVDTLMYYMTEFNNDKVMAGYKIKLKHFSLVFEEEYESDIIILGVSNSGINSCIRWGVYDFAPANILMLEESDYNDLLLMNSYDDRIIMNGEESNKDKNKSIIKL